MPREQSVIKLNIARLHARTAKFPSEQGYRESVRDQFRELQYALESVYQQLEDASPAIMYNALLPTFDKSQVYVPVKTGDLKASGYLEITNTVRGSQRVELGYGRGGQPWYAMYVHENLNSYHKPPTRAKWLQEAVYEDLPELPNRLARMYQMFMF